jgi:uncharacterized protein (DUF1499 family)
MTLARTGLIVSLTSLVLLAAGPLGTRAGVWTFIIGFVLLALSLVFGLAGAGLSLVAGIKTGQWMLPLLGIVIGLAVVAMPSSVIVSARGAPPIHEITTDMQDPPAFVAILPLRAGAANPPEYGGSSVADQQRRAFPDIQPVVLAVTPQQAFERALSSASQLGWEVVSRDVAAGRIEAVATTFWFGFKDDIIIRIRSAAEGSRVDIRSKSRVGVGDLGANARRVRAFVAALRDTA